MKGRFLFIFFFCFSAQAAHFKQRVYRNTRFLKTVCTRLLQDSGITSVDEPDLISASYDGDIALVRSLLRKDKKRIFNKYTKSELSTSLFYAIYQGHMDLAHCLIDYGASVNSGPAKVYPLMRAWQERDYDLVKKCASKTKKIAKAVSLVDRIDPIDSDVDKADSIDSDADEIDPIDSEVDETDSINSDADEIDSDDPVDLYDLYDGAAIACFAELIKHLPFKERKDVLKHAGWWQDCVGLDEGDVRTRILFYMGVKVTPEKYTANPGNRLWNHYISEAMKDYMKDINWNDALCFLDLKTKSKEKEEELRRKLPQFVTALHFARDHGGISEHNRKHPTNRCVPSLKQLAFDTYVKSLSKKKVAKIDRLCYNKK